MQRQRVEVQVTPPVCFSVLSVQVTTAIQREILRSALTLACLLSAVPELLLVLEELTPMCPPSLLVTWQPVTPDYSSQLNGPEDDTEFIVMWEKVGGDGGGDGRGDGRGELNEPFSNTTTVSAGASITSSALTCVSLPLRTSRYLV